MSFVPVPWSFFLNPPLLYISFICAIVNTGSNAEFLSLQSEVNCGYVGITQTLGGRPCHPCDKSVGDTVDTTHTLMPLYLKREGNAKKESSTDIDPGRVSLHPAWSLVPIFRSQRSVEYGVPENSVGAASQVVFYKPRSWEPGTGFQWVFFHILCVRTGTFGSRFSLAILSSKACEEKVTSNLKVKNGNCSASSFEFYCLANLHRPFRDAECLIH